MAKTKSKKVTPLMQQYFQVKSAHPDALLLFRVGDFYETFAEDAIKCSNALGIVLTSRNNGGSDIELAGFPYHSLDVYLPKLVKSGFRVAICEQLEKPSKEKKIVKRGVTDVVTPGVSFHDNILDFDKNNFLASIHFEAKDKIGVAFIDVSTAEFYISQGNPGLINKLLQTFQPNEVIYSKPMEREIKSLQTTDLYLYPLEDWIFSHDFAIEKLQDHFNVKTFKGYGIETLTAGQVAAGTILQYLHSIENKKLDHIQNIQRLNNEDFLWLDQFTIKNLELLNSQHPSGTSLIDILDKTKSPMGARLLKKWTVMPLVSLPLIQNRLDQVDYLLTHEETKQFVINQIQKMGDLERFASKISIQKLNPREFIALLKSLTVSNEIKEFLAKSEETNFKVLSDKIVPCEALIEKLSKAITPEPPVNLQKGYVIKEGYHETLDEYRYLISNSKGILLEIQQREIAATGITNLKIGFNNVFGYYLEVTNKYKNQGLIPENWIRKQTLTNAERYISEELKEIEQKILQAQEKMFALEEKLYAELLAFSKDYIPFLLNNAQIIASLDCIGSFATIADTHDYCKPVLDEAFKIEIKQARHPVIECQLEHKTSYIPNDIYLDNEDQQIIMITGPNMSGKSAVLRQTALICLMAQMGCYVPAKSAHLGILDKIFTRVGASDNISSGESTFMVEMNETSSIMNNISSRSLLLLDEIGRGTSTYDGISIAWSIAEFLHNGTDLKPKTLFATHYHELNELSKKYPRIRNYHISTREVNNEVVFLRKLTEGGSKHSFGIHVAKMAGMPAKIVNRAQVLLKELEKKTIDNTINGTLNDIAAQPQLQLNMFELENKKSMELLQQIEDMDINSMTPIECMMKLAELKKIAED